MDFCETHPLPLTASIQLTPSLDHVFKHVPPASSRFHVYSVAETRQSVPKLFVWNRQKFPMLNACHLRPSINLSSPLLHITLPSLRQRPLHYPPIYLLAQLFVSPCCQLPSHSSRSVLALLCSAGNSVVCIPIPNSFSEEHLAVSFTLLTIRPTYCY